MNGTVSRLKLLWISACSQPDTKWKLPFGRLFNVREVNAAELDLSESAPQWDAVCFDFDFPDMLGLRLIQETKSRWPSAPIVMLTLQGSLELGVWALRSRVFDLLVKPPADHEFDRLLERLGAAARARRSQMERRPQTTAALLPAETRYRSHPPPAARLRAALAHVAKNYLRPIRESEAASLCDMAPSRFCREFKAAFDKTFVEYLAHYRMTQAKRLLANPTMPVADVAVAVGFHDPSYFTRVFRRQEGVSPSEYRANAILEAANG
jgi:AraC-like DNA-binding protein